jgi:ribokinase
VYSGADGLIATPASVVDAVDTTAAGDTFLGYYLAQRAKGVDVRRSMTIAHRAAAICVSRHGAIESIPTWAEVESLVGAGA